MALPILRTTEDACAWLATTASLSASFSVPVYTGINNLDKTGPCVICYAESATEDFPFSGIYHVSTNIIVKEMAADTSTGSLLATTLFEAFLNNKTKTALNSYSSSYFVYEYWVTDTSDTIEQDAWIQQFRLEVVSALT
jgi:hypothetical protein